MSYEVIDARGLLCPLPVIRAQNKAKQLKAGDTLEIICTDPGAMHDIPSWCRIHGHKIIEIQQENEADEFSIIVEI